MRRPRGIAIGIGASLAVLAVLASGCGGNAEKVHYTASTTVQCLKQKAGVRDLNTSRRDISLLPESSIEGVFKMKTETGNVAIVVFESNPAVANEYADAFASFYRKFGSFGYVPLVRANVASLWQRDPARSEERLLSDCLSAGGSAIPLVDQDPSSAHSYDYGVRSINGYVAECVGAGFEQGACRCMVEWAEQRYPEGEFGREFRRRAVVAAVLKSCRRGE